MDRGEVKEDHRPQHILHEELENDFFDHLPTHDEGLAL